MAAFVGKEVGRSAAIQGDATGIQVGTGRGEQGTEHKPHFCAAMRVDLPASHPPVSLPRGDPCLGLLMGVISLGSEVSALTHRCEHPVQSRSNPQYPKQGIVIPEPGWSPDRQI